MHHVPPRTTVRCALACLCFSPLLAVGQTTNVTNDVVTVTSLTSGSTATVTGKAEFHVTGTGDPIPSCIINLNSADAWFFMDNIKPSSVIATFLSRVRVNGAVAVNGTNARVTQYGAGAVVIPQWPSYGAMEAFDDRYLTGQSMPLSSYTAYNNALLGTFAAKMSSFRLKRGYTATIATVENGTGYSRNYVAAEGDLEVPVLPATLDNAVTFVRIFPWRWTVKKGIAGTIADGLNVGWSYNWNIDQNSSADLEYVPIRAQRWWPGLGQDWAARGSNQLLGYNEPDSASQSNIAVGDAVWSWPDLLGTGLRVGSPAPTDGGLGGWLYPFITQCATENKRVDFVAVHYYRSYSDPANPTGAANQFYNFLLGIYNTTKKPIWITEWNNGANWTSDPDPTAAQQAATVNAMLDMLENAHFVERYSIYNWVEDVRRVKWDDGSLTAAGVNYRDHATKIGYRQEMPDPEVNPIASYPFDTDARDATGSGFDAMNDGTPALIAGKYGNALSFDGVNDSLVVSSRLGDSTDFTFAGWIYPATTTAWQRVFDFGDGQLRYMFLSPRSSGGQLRFAINTGSGEQTLSGTAPATGVWTHVAVTITGSTGKLFVNGALVATNTSMTYDPSAVGTRLNYIGKSQFDVDPLFNGRLDDLRFYNTALTDAQIASIASTAPPRFNSATLAKASGASGTAYSASLSADATGGVAGTRTYAKLAGPAWLSVASNGALSGTPTAADSGLNTFLVRVTDGFGCHTANVTITVTGGDTNLALAGTASASSNEAGNTPANARDGSLATRWTASSASYPQWWKVDLGASRVLSRVSIPWYSSTTRAYQYKVEVSADDVTYATVADKTANANFGDTTDWFTANARYVRITVLGCSSGGWAAFWEGQVFGH